MSNRTLQPFYAFEKNAFGAVGNWYLFDLRRQLLFDNQLITNSFFDKTLLAGEQLSDREKVKVANFNPVGEKVFEAISVKNFRS